MADATRNCCGTSTLDDCRCYSSPTTVLPDARAREVLADARIAAGNLFGDCPEPIAIAAMLAYAKEATPPASDSAVPAGVLTEKATALRKQRDMHYAEGRPWKHLRFAAEVLDDLAAAAPKVASDTGAKLSDDDAIIAEFAFLYREYGLADDATLAPDAIGLKRKVLAALATDATDGATGGGEKDQAVAQELVEWWDTGVLRDGLVRAEAASMLAAGKADDHSAIRQAEHAITSRIVRRLATTPGGDLLEQVVAIVNEEGPQNPESDWTNYARTRATMRDAILKRLRALSARNQTDDGGEK